MATTLRSKPKSVDTDAFVDGAALLEAADLVGSCGVAAALVARDGWVTRRLWAPTNATHIPFFPISRSARLSSCRSKNQTGSQTTLVPADDARRLSRVKSVRSLCPGLRLEHCGLRSQVAGNGKNPLCRSL